MLVLPKSKWIFFLWIERLVHIVQRNFWINPCDRSLKQRLTIHTIYPYETKQRSKYARSVVKGPCHCCLAAVRTLKESSHFIEFSILHCPRRVTISVSAYYIRDYQRICFVTWISEIAPRVHLKSSEGEQGAGAAGGGGLLHMNLNLDSTNIIITGHKIVSEHSRSHIYAHTSTFFRLWGGGGRIFWIWGLPKSHKYIHVHVSKIPCIYTC